MNKYTLKTIKLSRTINSKPVFTDSHQKSISEMINEKKVSQLFKITMGEEEYDTDNMTWKIVKDWASEDAKKQIHLFFTISDDDLRIILNCHKSDLLFFDKCSKDQKIVFANKVITFVFNDYLFVKYIKMIDKDRTKFIKLSYTRFEEENIKREKIFSNFDSEMLVNVISENKEYLIEHIDDNKMFAKKVFEIINKIYQSKQLKLSKEQSIKDKEKYKLEQKSEQKKDEKNFLPLQVVQDLSKLEDNEIFCRIMCEDELLSTKKKGYLDVNRMKKADEKYHITEKAVWVYRKKGSYRPSAKGFVVEFKMNEMTALEFKNRVICVSEETGNDEFINSKSNEPGAYGIGKKLLEMFQYIGFRKL